jgi:hypothetical protein
VAYVAAWPPGKTPYVTPDQLNQWPTGVQWSTIPPKTGGSAPTAPQQYAVQSMLCAQATERVDQILNQPLRATETTEELSGPNFRVTVQWASQNGRFIASRWPVTQVLNVQVSPNATWPRSWTVLPAQNFEPEYPVDGLYGASVPSASGGGQAILFAPGWVDWSLGRFGYRVSCTYISGYPHTSITAEASSGAGSITVDDCSGWVLTATSGGNVGAAGTIYDALGGGQESFAVTAASAATGPGTLTLASPLNFTHAPGIAVSAMPSSAIWATALLAAQAALVRGATATTSQTTSGRQQAGMHPLESEARALLSTFRRTI